MISIADAVDESSGEEEKGRVAPCVARHPPTLAFSRLGQTLRWARDPVGLLREAATSVGDCFTLTMADPAPMAVFSHPRHVEQIFSADPSQLLAGRANAIFGLAFGDRNLLSLDGVEHDVVRRLIGGPLGCGRVPAFAERVAAVARRHIDGWPEDDVVDVHRLMQLLALDVILDVLFGPALSTVEEFRAVVLELVDRIADLGRRPGTGQRGFDDPVTVARQTVRRLCFDESSRRGDGAASASLLDQLARFVGGGGRDSEAILDQLVALSIAGHETTATALTWATARAVLAEGVLGALLDEIDGRDAPCSTGPYLEAVLHETLRLHPAFPVLPRFVAADLDVGEFHLAAGDTVAASAYLSHRHPEVWCDPESFRPERFLRRRSAPTEYYPFGSGARQCLGIHFALLEMRVVLANVFCRWRVEPATPGLPQTVRRSLTLAPRDGFRVRLSRR